MPRGRQGLRARAQRQVRARPVTAIATAGSVRCVIALKTGSSRLPPAAVELTLSEMTCRRLDAASCFVPGRGGLLPHLQHRASCERTPRQPHANTWPGPRSGSHRAGINARVIGAPRCGKRSRTDRSANPPGPLRRHLLHIRTPRWEHTARPSQDRRRRSNPGLPSRGDNLSVCNSNDTLT